VVLVSELSMEIHVARYDNGEIKLWNIYSGECVRTLQGQQNGVVRLIVDSEGVLISCGFAKTLNLFG